MKRLLLLLVTIALLASFAAGCGGSTQNSNSNSNPTSTDSNNNKKTKLVIWETEKTVLTEAIADYEAENDDVTIVIEAYPGDITNLLALLKMSIGAGTAPDMMCSPSDYIWSAGKLGYIKDLTQYGAAEVKDLFTESTWEAANANPNAIYSLPFDSNIINFLCNSKMLGEAGVEIPTNLDEMKNVAAKIKARYGSDSGKYAYAGPLTVVEGVTYVAWSTFHYYWYLWRFGGDIFNADFTECTINSEAAVEALQFLADMKTNGDIDPSWGATEFWAGNVAMMCDVTIWFYTNLAAADGDYYSVAMMPTMKEGVDPYTGLGLYCYSVLDTTKNGQAAYDFIEFLCTNEDYQVDYCKPLYFIPSLKSALDNSYFKTQDWQIILEQSKYAKATPGVENWQQMDQAIYDAMQAVFNGTSSAKVALDTAQAAITNMMVK